MSHWEPVDGEDELAANVVETSESFMHAMHDWGAGVCNAVLKDVHGRPLAVISVADIDGRFVGVHVVLQS